MNNQESYNRQLIDRMSAIVESTMTSFKTDFYQYDRKTILSAETISFPYIWIVGPTHTYLLIPGLYQHDFFAYESQRWAYIQYGETGMEPFLRNTGKNDRIYLITPRNLREITITEASEIIIDVKHSVVTLWEQQNGRLPKRRHVDVRFKNITISKLKSLIRECHAHGDDSLLQTLRRFHRYGRCSSGHYVEVCWRPDDNRFRFYNLVSPDKCTLDGSITFHGWPETGYRTNGSVMLDPDYGWHSHT